MKKKKGLILFLAIIACITVGILIKNSPKEEIPTVSYVEVIRMIEDNQVDKIIMQNDSSTIHVILNDETNYESIIIDKETFIEFVQKQLESGQNIDISIENDESSVLFLNILSIIPSLLWLVILGYMIVTLFKLSRKLTGTNSKNNNDNIPSFMSPFGSGINYSQKAVNSDVHFSDVAGLNEEKQELEEVVSFLKYPDLYTRLGAKIPKGVLLHGNPGTGKTLLAKAVAGEAGVKFLAVSGSEFIEKYVGVGASRIRELFEEARKHTPCIIFIDEIDAIGSERDNSHSEQNQTIEQLLAEMDGFGSKRDIIVLAATNRVDSLDSALTRPGRFDRKIYVGLPDVNGRFEILKIHSKNKPMNRNVDLKRIAYHTAGFSGAELENLLNESAIIAARKKHNGIGKEDIDEALKKITVGLKKSGKVVSKKERILTANHEAGHALVSLCLKSQSSIKEVSIVPRGTAGGYTWHDSKEDKNYHSRTELKEELTVLMAGRAAEEIVLGDISTGASSDLQVATKLAKEMIIYYGMNSKIGPISFSGSTSKEISIFGNEILSNIGKEVKETLKEAENSAKEIINNHRPFLDYLAKRLLERETITGDELQHMFKEYSLQLQIANIRN